MDARAGDQRAHRVRIVRLRLAAERGLGGLGKLSEHFHSRPRCCTPGVRNLAGQTVSGFLDSCAQRGVIRQGLADDEDSASWYVDIDRCDAGQLAEFGLDGAGTVVARHAGYFESAGFHDCDSSLRSAKRSG